MQTSAVRTECLCSATSATHTRESLTPAAILTTTHSNPPALGAVILGTNQHNRHRCNHTTQQHCKQQRQRSRHHGTFHSIRVCQSIIPGRGSCRRWLSRRGGPRSSTRPTWGWRGRQPGSPETSTSPAASLHNTAPFQYMFFNVVVHIGSMYNIFLSDYLYGWTLQELWITAKK